MNKKDKEEIKQIVEESLEKKRGIDIEDILAFLLETSILLFVFGSLIYLILNLAGVV